MMLAPSIYNDLFTNFFEDFGGMFRRAVTPSNAGSYSISTDVKEFEDHYLLDMELPGYKKEDIKVSLKDNYLTVSATHDDTTSEKDENGKVVRRERTYGKCSRSFYVGKNLTKENIHASYDNGVLTLNVPKITEAPQVEEDNLIAIEG